MAASATVGNKLWTKTTLVGVESAINSRFRFSDDITFCIERTLLKGAGDDSISSREVDVFEVELERPVPIGTHILIFHSSSFFDVAFENIDPTTSFSYLYFFPNSH